MAEAEPDWSLWRSFAAVVQDGSLSAAARRLGLSQPTLGRHVEALEQALGLSLFERTLQGLRPTETALRLYEPVAEAQKALAEAMLRAEGTAGTLEGSVRITASNIVMHYVLPELLAGIRQEFPAVALELVSSDSPENLLLREADIAVRMFRPTQLELVTRRLGTVEVIPCAHEDYLARRGTPQRVDQLVEHDLIGFDRSEIMTEAARGLGFNIDRRSFILRTDSQTLTWELCRAGLGIGFGQVPMVRDAPGIVPVLPGLVVGELEVWLTTHRELFTSRRIRAIYDRLAAALTEYLRRPGPPTNGP